MFNRKFREKAEAAYGDTPRAVEVEKTIIRNYVMALTDKDLARKIITESGAETLAEVIRYADKVATGIELFDTIFSQEEPMDVSVVTSPAPAKDHVDLKKQIERQNTKIDKLEAQLKQERDQKVTTRSLSQEVQCYLCGQFGHIKRDCRKAQGAHNFSQGQRNYQQSPRSDSSNYYPSKHQVPRNRRLN